MSNAKTLHLQFADGEIEVGTLIDALYEQDRTIAILRQHKTDYMEAAEGTRRALEAECQHLRQAMLRLVTTYCAAATKNNATTTDLDQYLSAGIAQLEAGILELRAQLAAIKGQEVSGGN